MHYFLHLHTRRLGSVYPGIAPDVVEILRKHRWPGNLREYGVGEFNSPEEARAQIHYQYRYFYPQTEPEFIEEV